MSNSLKIDNILSQINKLDSQARLRLYRKFSKLLKKEKSQNKAIHLTEFSELDNSIWKNINVDDFIKNERKWD